MKILHPKDKRKCAEIRLVRVNPVHAAEFGARIDFSRQSSGIRIQFWKWEVIAYVKYGLYNHEIPGTASYLNWQAIRSKRSAEDATK